MVSWIKAGAVIYDHRQLVLHGGLYPISEGGCDDDRFRRARRGRVIGKAESTGNLRTSSSAIVSRSSFGNSCTTWRKTSSVASDHMGGRSRRGSIDEVHTKEDCARVYWTDSESYALQDVSWAGNDMKDLRKRKSDPMMKRPSKVNVAPPALKTQAKSTASLEHTVLLSTMEHHSLQTPLILARLAEQRATASSQMRPKTLIGKRETPVG
ncbi:hypothetical protein C8R45DRAFT_936931 [Mycena sanguinolenta]|nr:hypothetical protein C8R45DRAFT_936931 [Mycena sanguinolenta]